jgi:preprotein translocase subunit SecB
MIAAPLQLRDYRTTTISYERLDAETPPDDVDLGVGLSFGVDAEFDDEEEVQLIELDVRYNEEDRVPEEAAPYIVHRGHVRVTGQFYWADEEVAARDDARRLLLTNGLSMLYGIARVRVADVTADGKEARLVLPSINFLPIAEDWLSEGEDVDAANNEE